MRRETSGASADIELSAGEARGYDWTCASPSL